MIPLAVFMPTLAFAQGSFGEVEWLFEDFADLINDTLAPLIFGLAFLLFAWGIFVYFIQGGANEEKRGKGKQLMIWGLIGFVIMVSVWGIIEILRNSLFT